MPLNIIQRQLGHTDLGVTPTYLQGIDNAGIVNAVHARKAPMMRRAQGCGSDSDEVGSVASAAHLLAPDRAKEQRRPPHTRCCV